MAQEKERVFEEKSLEALWVGEGFDQTRKDGEIPFYGVEPLSESERKRKSNSSHEQGYSRKRWGSNTLNGEAAQQVMYIFAGVILLVIVFLIVKNVQGGSGQKLKTELPNLEDGDIQGLDTRGLIAQAVAHRDFRSAVRLNYLDILKKLDEKKWIKWVAHKTNQDYVRELAKHPHSASFNLLTHHFDYTWYGDFEIEEALYKKLEAQFQQFHLKIGEGK